MPRSKRYQALLEKIDQEKLYPLEEATALVKETSNTKFSGGVELHVRLGIDISKSDQQVRATVTLPHGSGKVAKVAVFAEDAAAKDAKAAGADLVGGEELIAEIKKTCLPSDDALKLDYECLYGSKIEPSELKKSLIALPAISGKRLILIRTVEKLNTQNKKILLDFIQSENEHAVLILDSDEVSPKNSFMNKISAVAKVMRFGSGTIKKNVFDMTRRMENRDSSGALKILEHLMSGGDHPLQIMGGLVWFWGKSKNRLSKDHFKKGLLVLQEADLNIKRSRLKPEYAVEIAVTKLSSLIAC